MRFLERECCPACESRAAFTLVKSPFHEGPLGDFLRSFYRREPYEGTYQLDECINCSLIFQRFVADPELMADLYSGLARPEVDVPIPQHAGDCHELQSFAAFLGKPRLKVLDYGTGWGAWPIAARKLGHDAFATELAVERADWVRSQGVQIISDDEIAAYAFDVINLEQVLEHVAEPLQLLRQLTPSLSGLIKLSLPNSPRQVTGELARRDYRHIMPFHPFEHVNSFNPIALRKLVRRAGLREVRPSLRTLYSFHPTSARDLFRPIWRFYNPANLYMWAGPQTHF